jgi:hypothetical protein
MREDLNSMISIIEETLAMEKHIIEPLIPLDALEVLPPETETRWYISIRLSSWSVN